MAYIGNQPTTVAFLTDQFSGTGSQTAFTLSAAPANTASIIVAVSGVLQDPTTYSVSGTTLTFSAAPPSGTGNISVRFLGIPASGVTTTAYRTQTEFTATAGQTTFSVPSYTVGFIDVYRNGALLGSADFTATNGTTVVLAAGASAGDLVETVSFFVSSVLNAIPATAGAVNSMYLLDGGVTTAKIADANVTQAKLGTGVAGNGPAFRAVPSTTQSVTSATYTKINFGTENWDTNSNFASSRFTPTVAGYYFISGAVYATFSGSATYVLIFVFKNGAQELAGNLNVPVTTSDGIGIVNGLVYMNGTTDYVEMYCYLAGTSPIVQTVNNTQFSGFLARSA
jgi:hypothetical protein